MVSLKLGKHDWTSQLVAPAGSISMAEDFNSNGHGYRAAGRGRNVGESGSCYWRSDVGRVTKLMYRVRCIGGRGKGSRKKDYYTRRAKPPTVRNTKEENWN